MSPGRLLIPILSACLFIPGVALASETSELREQVRQILEQNKILQEQLNRQNEIVGRLLIRIDELETVSGVTDGNESSFVAPDPPAQEVAVQALSELDAEISRPPSLVIRGFTDVSFGVTDSDFEGERANTFSLHELDLFITSQIADDLSVLSELTFHFEDISEGGFFEVERLQLAYAPSDLFRFTLGRMHTPIGYWNHHFHHGGWFQTSISRPLIHLFEDDGGILPVHAVGAEVAGLAGLGPMDFRYSASVLNGRGRYLDEIQNVRDANRHKAVNLHIGFEPNGSPGLNVGLSTYIDRIPENPLSASRQGEMNELILAGHFVYLRGGIEFLGELVNLNHKEPVSGGSFDTFGLYTQVAYRLEKWNPYFRFDRIDFDEADPLFVFPNQVDTEMTTLGIRWDVRTWMGLRFEYRTTNRERTTSHAGIFQSTFVF